MTKEQLLEMWTDELEKCAMDYRNQEEWASRSRRGNVTKPDHHIFTDRFSSRVDNVYKDELDQLPEEERANVTRKMITMMLDKLRDMNVNISYEGDLGKFVKIDPKNIQYMDLLAWNCSKERFLVNMVKTTPAVLDFLTMEQFNEISKGNQEYIMQLVKNNPDIAKRAPISEIVASNPALTKEITILEKENEVRVLGLGIDEKKKEFEVLEKRGEKEPGLGE